MNNKSQSYSKRIMLIFLAFAMIMAFMPSMAFAENSVSGTMSSSQFLAAKDNNNTITLEGDVTLSDNLVISDGSTLIINLNGNTLSAKDTVIKITHGNVELTGEGEVKENSPYYAPVFLEGSANPNNENYTTVTVGKDVTLTGWSGLFIDYIEDNGSKVGYGIVADVYGTLNSVKDTAGYGGHALYVNGSLTATEGNIPKITLNGARLNTVAGNGMYLAGYAITNINNSTIDSSSEGGTGIEIRAGELTINNSVIKGGTGKTDIAPNGNGSTTENVALAVVQHTTRLPVEVTVSNSVFSAGASLFEQNAQENDADAIAKIKINVQSGSFTGSVYSENKTGFISGGEFTADLSNTKYVSEAVQAKAEYVNANGTTYLIGKDVINNKLATATSGTVTITEAAQGVEFVAPAKGVTIANESGDKIVVVDGDKKVEVGDNSSYVTPAEQPEGDKPQGDKNADGSPDTGDESSMMLMVALMAMAAGAGATAFVRRRSN